MWYTHIPWNVTQPQKGTKLCNLQTGGWTQRLSYRAKESQKEKPCTVSLMWKLENWYRWAYPQSRHRDTDIQIVRIPGKEGRAGRTERLGLTYIYRCVYNPEEGTATVSTVPAWGTAWTEEPGGLQSPAQQSQSRRKWLSTHACTYKTGN